MALMVELQLGRAGNRYNYARRPGTSWVDGISPQGPPFGHYSTIPVSCSCSRGRAKSIIPSMWTTRKRRLLMTVRSTSMLWKSTTTKEEEKIYLGPHGAPPSQAKQQDPSAAGRKQRLKQKLKEADHKYSGTGRENKADTIRELVGNKMVTKTVPKNSQREWLDPHCHESYFERWWRRPTSEDVGLLSYLLAFLLIRLDVLLLEKFFIKISDDAMICDAR
ncbi:hypothetical protein KSP39_PZI019861 [Platanthera zijinensis]|uniref:Uncharacterized protein n=1 Tax=Platanthera zijinensis TaxID=2320716 RepID=A0AAP0B1Y6_9ASPA